MAENKNVRLSNPMRRSPFNKNSRPKENELIKKLQEEGIIKSLSLGAKYCLPTSKLNYEQIAEIKKLLGEESAEHVWKSLSMSESGWLAFNVDIKDVEKIKPALEKYREYAKDSDELFISGYGEINVHIDYEKLGMFMDPDTGNIYYPYGAFFFSDNKTLVNQFAASVACLQYKYQKINNKKHISPISSENWTDAEISGTVTRRGHLVIFYVSEDVEKEPGIYHPIVKTIDIEVVAVKNYKTSEVENVYIGKVDQQSQCVSDQIEYLINNVYKKYGIASRASVSFMSDYIFSVGSYPKNYDLAITERPDTPADENQPKFKSNFVGSDKAHRANTDKNSEDKAKKTSKNKKGSKAKQAKVETEVTKETVSDESSKEASVTTEPADEVPSTAEKAESSETTNAISEE